MPNSFFINHSFILHVFIYKREEETLVFWWNDVKALDQIRNWAKVKKTRKERITWQLWSV